MLREIQKEVHSWSLYNFGDQPSWRPLLGVGEEVGELNHGYLKREQSIRLDEDHAAMMKDAVADIMIYLLDFCSREGIDLQTELENTWAKVKKRNWKANPHSAHVSV